MQEDEKGTTHRFDWLTKKPVYYNTKSSNCVIEHNIYIVYSSFSNCVVDYILLTLQIKSQFFSVGNA